MPPVDNLIRLYREQGWNDEAAIRADINAGGWRSKVQSGSSSFPAPQAQPSFDPIEQARKLRQFNIEANQPQIASLQAQIPEVQQRFTAERGRLQGEVDPIKQRYQTIIDELKRREGVETQQTQTALAREFGRRGIPQSSGLVEQTGLERTQPISQFYGIQQRETQGALESSLRNLQGMITGIASGEIEATRGIKNAIGQLQSGDPASAIQGAMNLLQLQEQQRQFGIQQGLEQEKLNFTRQAQSVEQAMQQQKFAQEITQYNQTLAENQRQFNVQESRLGRTSTPGPTKLEFRTEKDSGGNEFVTAYDPYTGKVVSTSRPIQTQSTQGLQQQFGFDLGEAISGAWNWFTTGR